MSAVSAPAAVARVFISCPGDLATQRSVVSQALASLNRNPEFAGRVELVPYAYENVVPARSGMDAQEVVDSYMLRADDADLVICMFWRRMGTPLAHVLNPATNAPYQSGTEYEYLSAYAAAQRRPTPQILLYRCQRNAPNPATPEEWVQLDRVNQFFARFQSGGDLRGLHGSFHDDDDLVATIQRDVAQLLRGGLLSLLKRRTARPTNGSVIFGLPALPAGYVERPASLNTLRKALLGSRPQVGVVAATALHGLGGLGKTVLARAICDDPSVRAAFPNGILWATVGQRPDIARIQREWIRVLGGDIVLASSPESGRSELTRLIGDRAMLLILDDVWQAEATAALEVVGPHCRTLITTRDASQAEGATRVSLDLMSPAECRQTLREAARGRAPDDVVLNSIAQRLGHLPLALQVVGALLALDLTWPEIAQELDEGHLPDITVGDRSIFEALAASVRLLPSDRQERYRELVIFPEDEPLNSVAVARLWAKTGGLTTFATRRLLAEFRDRSLIQADNTLHDLQVDYLHATIVSERARELHSTLCDAYAASGLLGDASPWSMLPDDDAQYGWRFIATHLSKAEHERDLEMLLTDVTWLQGKLGRLGSGALVADLSLLPHFEPARRVSLAVRAGSLVLDRSPNELMNQVRGRVGSITELHHTPEHPVLSFELYTQSLPQPDPALQRIFAGHTNNVHGCAFSPDGALALSASDDRTLRLWDVASGQELRRLAGHTGGVMGCVFSPDGALALSASADRTLRLWDVASGQALRRLEGHTDAVRNCAFSPDGALALSASFDRTLRLWDVASGQELRRLEGHTAAVTGCAFSPDGALALSASYDWTLRLWDVASGQELRRLAGHANWAHDGWVHGCAFSPDGALALSASADGTLRLWDVASGQALRRLLGHTDAVYSCAFSPDGALALSASYNRTLRLWDVATRAEIAVWRNDVAILCCTFSPHVGYVAVGDEAGGVHLFKLIGAEP